MSNETILNTGAEIVLGSSSSTSAVSAGAFAVCDIARRYDNDAGYQLGVFELSTAAGGFSAAPTAGAAIHLYEQKVAINGEPAPDVDANNRHDYLGTFFVAPSDTQQHLSLVAPIHNSGGVYWLEWVDGGSGTASMDAGWELRLIPATDGQASSPPSETFTVATGGTIITQGDYKIHIITTATDFHVTQVGDDPTVEYILIAGGGGGGYSRGGGGGAGGVITGTFQATTMYYSATIGAGGAGGTSGKGSNGGSTILDMLIAHGGGGGDSASTQTGGNSGGSGGGGCDAGVGGTGTAGEGNDGGDGIPAGSPGYGAGGGGGSQGVGGDGSSSSGGRGGRCLWTTLMGKPIGVGGGGGGGAYGGGGGVGGAGGVGGGDGASYSPGGSGVAQTGGGGGGGGYSGGAYAGGAGGSGVAATRYKYK